MDSYDIFNNNNYTDKDPDARQALPACSCCMAWPQLCLQSGQRLQTHATARDTDIVKSWAHVHVSGLHDYISPVKKFGR